MTYSACRMLIVVAALALSGCGFKPLYATHDGSTSASPQVKEAFAATTITPIADRDGMKLRQMLREGLQPSGPPEHPRYVLDVQMRSRTDNMGIRMDATASHANMIYTARFSISEGGKRLFSDTVQAVVSYNILDDQYATVSAIGNSADQAIAEVGQEIELRLAVFFEKQQRQVAANH